MAKWADYGISCVNYTSDGNRIATAGVHQDLGDEMGPRKTWHRSQIVDGIQKGYSFITILKDGQGKWVKGAPVRTVRVGNDTFIKTDANNTARDNLGSLPNC